MNNRKHDRMERIEGICLIAGCLMVAALLIRMLVTGAAHAETAEAAAAAQGLDLTNLVQALLAALATLITGYLIPWLKTKAGNEKQEMVNSMIDIAVYAAQQLYETNEISDRLDYACKWLEEHGVTVDRAQVEAGVKRYRNGNLAALIGTANDEAEEGTE